MNKIFKEYNKVVIKPKLIIKIFRKNSKKPFCEFEIQDKTLFDKLLTDLNDLNETRFIKFGPLIFDKYDFDYATYEEI